MWQTNQIQHLAFRRNRVTKVLTDKHAKIYALKKHQSIFMNYSLRHHISIGPKTSNTILSMNYKVCQTIYFKDNLKKQRKIKNFLQWTLFPPSSSRYFKTALFRIRAAQTQNRAEQQTTVAQPATACTSKNHFIHSKEETFPHVDKRGWSFAALLTDVLALMSPFKFILF